MQHAAVSAASRLVARPACHCRHYADGLPHALGLEVSGIRQKAYATLGGHPPRHLAQQHQLFCGRRMHRNRLIEVVFGCAHGHGHCERLDDFR